MIEPLEARTHFARAIHITINKAAITVRGSDAAEHLYIGGNDYGPYGDPGGGYNISVDEGTAMFVNGEALDYVSIESGTPLWYRPLRIKTGGGDDIVEFGGYTTFHQLSVDTGAGNDSVTANRLSGGFFAFDGGLGDDSISLELVPIDSIEDTPIVIDTLAVYGGPDRDSIKVTDLGLYDEEQIAIPTAGLAGKLLVHDSGGGVDITLRGLRVGRQAAIQTLNGDDRVTIERCRFLRPLTIRTFGGTDVLTASRTSFRQSYTLDLGDNGRDDTVSGFPAVR